MAVAQGAGLSKSSEILKLSKYACVICAYRFLRAVEARNLLLKGSKIVDSIEHADEKKPEERESKNNTHNLFRATADAVQEVIEATVRGKKYYIQISMKQIWSDGNLHSFE